MNSILTELGIKDENFGACSGPEKWSNNKDGGIIESINPANGNVIGSVFQATKTDYERIIKESVTAFNDFRKVPAPVRGQLVREMADALRKKKNALGSLVSMEMGKIKQEGDGEVQEMIDIADFAVGQSRMLYGKTMHSERPDHRMYEQWHPLGAIGVISAFNFPVAVWAWNAVIATICGDTTIWKPSSSAPLCAIAVQNICNEVMEKNGYTGIFSTVIGPGSIIGEKILNDKRIPLVSFTGSTAMGRHVSATVSERFGKTILELGGNNAIIIDETANMDLVIPAVVFGSVGTAGQRCTSTRRIIIHENIHDFLKAVEEVKSLGGEILCGGKRIDGNGFFVTPAIANAHNDWEIVQKETFAPILYVITYKTIEEALSIHNDVPQGLSSSMFTTNISNAERFLSYSGSDCGIANINIGTSGAEIGGAFGGEKETGGGRESGSDSWKQYMRRQTNTLNWSTKLPLAQGIEFNLDK